MNNDENWEEVDIPENEEASYEIEEEEQVEPQQAKPVQEEEQPQELEGIKTKGAEKRIRQLVRQRKERDEQIAKLLAQNEELSSNLKQKESSFNEVNKLNLDASEKQLTDKVTLARNAYMEAFESGEKEKLLQAQEMLNEAQVDLKHLNLTKAQMEEVAEQPEPEQAAPVQQPVQQTPDPRAEEWAANNEWFGKDKILTVSALTIDQELKAEGYDPDDEEFYQEVDRRLAEAFPHKFKSSEVPVEENQNRVQEDTSVPAQVVGSSSRSAPNSSKSKVKLTKEDVRLANKWNIPLETYAAQKLKVAEADGEYTQIS
jgi:hypothetical protein|tara:strand:+ start:606 stop:1550 length:945 start_codon:yes stop_codon:yes gene_type:complete